MCSWLHTFISTTYVLQENMYNVFEWRNCYSWKDLQIPLLFIFFYLFVRVEMIGSCGIYFQPLLKDEMAFVIVSYVHVFMVECVDISISAYTHKSKLNDDVNVILCFSSFIFILWKLYQLNIEEGSKISGFLLVIDVFFSSCKVMSVVVEFLYERKLL